jgi:predicted ArsR family transcriptional regulator
MTDDTDLPLFQPHKAVRRTDVDTSRESAHSMAATVHTHHLLILDVLGDNRQHSAEEVADRCSLDYVAVNRRLPELARAEMVERVTEKHVNRSGRQAYRYRITGRGLHAVQTMTAR